MITTVHPAGEVVYPVEGAEGAEDTGINPDNRRSLSYRDWAFPMIFPMPPHIIEEGVPRYRRIANALRQKIINGEPGYCPGDRLPSEPQLQREYGNVARETIRSAIRVLREERLVIVEIGIGSFIRPREDWALK